jgi:hypothetical protein
MLSHFFQIIAGQASRSQNRARSDPHPLTIVAANLKAVGAQRRLRASLRLCRCCNPNDSGGRWKISGRRHTIYGKANLAESERLDAAFNLVGAR